MKQKQAAMALIGTAIISVTVGYLAGMGGREAQMGHRLSDDAMQHGSMQMDAMVAALDGKTGVAFDHEFLAQMIVHHEGALAMASRVLEVSESEALKQFARGIIETQSNEILMMQRWQLNPASMDAHGSIEPAMPGNDSSVSTPPSAGAGHAGSPGGTSPGYDGGMVACTMEAKICPDGSAVGRQGPNCEFAKCPGE